MVVPQAPAPYTDHYQMPDNGLITLKFRWLVQISHWQKKNFVFRVLIIFHMKKYLHADFTLDQTVSELWANPGLCISDLAFKSDLSLMKCRWFAEKNAHIENVRVTDTFRLAISDFDGGQIAEGIIARFQLRKTGKGTIIKHYFIPIILSRKNIRELPDYEQFSVRLSDGECHFGFAEHTFLFQKAIVRHCKKSGFIRTSERGKVRFRQINSIIGNIDEAKITVSPVSMKFSSSNMLTHISYFDKSGDQGGMISKTYRDMRELPVQNNKIWLPNPEVPRYEALAAGKYPHIPELYATVQYQSPNGDRTSLCVIMEAVSARARVGEFFWKSLTQLTAGLETVQPDSFSVSCCDFRQYERHVRGIRFFACETAKTLARMHSAFLNSGKSDFHSVQADADDISRWSDTAMNHFKAAMAALDHRVNRNKYRPRAKILSELTKMLDGAASDPGKMLQRHDLHAFRGILMKAQVHGDMHGDQGMISRKGAMKYDISTAREAADLAAGIKWLDFEGPPAKECVFKNYDSRENLLTDLAGMIQAFWYMVNIKLYEHMGRLNHENPHDHEKQREASLMLAGQSDGKSSLVCKKNGGESERMSAFAQVLNLWQHDMTEAFIDGYFDEAEKLGIQNAILKKWDRNIARTLINYWILARAFHELRYETYARDWGWEAIPGGSIIRILNGK